MNEYTFDFSKMSVGDLVFLSGIDAASNRDPAQVSRLFALLGRVTVGIDDIPAAKLGEVMQAMTTALVDYVKVSAMYGPTVDALRFDEPTAPPDPEPATKRCARCRGRVKLSDGELCHWCKAMVALRAESEALTGYNRCVRCGARYSEAGTICTACGHDHDPAAHEPGPRPRSCMICGEQWYGTQMMCPECSKKHG